MASYQELGPDKNGKPRIKITVELGYDEKGTRKRRHKTVTLNTLSERTINKAITNFEIEVANDKPKDSSDLTYRQAVDLWWDNHVTKLAVKSQEAYGQSIKASLDYFRDMKIKKMKKIHLIEFKTHLIDSDVGVKNGKLDVCKAVLTKMVEWELLGVNPALNVSFPKKKTTMDFYNEQEIAELFNALEDSFPKYKIFFKLAVLSGMRSAEMRGLTIKNVDFESNQIHVRHNLNFKKDRGFFLGPTKNKKERTIDMPEKFMQEFKEYVETIKNNKEEFGDKWRGLPNMDLVFCNPDGYPNEESVYAKGLKVIQRRNNLRIIRVHDLRHTHASFLLSKGENMKVIQERLGHSSVTLTLDTYSHLTEKDKQSAATILNEIL